MLGSLVKLHLVYFAQLLRFPLVALVPVLSVVPCFRKIRVLLLVHKLNIGAHLLLSHQLNVLCPCRCDDH